MIGHYTAISNRPATEVWLPYLEQRTSSNLKLQTTITLKLQWSTRWDYTDLYIQNKAWRQNINLHLQWHNHEYYDPKRSFQQKYYPQCQSLLFLIQAVSVAIICMRQQHCTSTYVGPPFQRQKEELATTVSQLSSKNDGEKDTEDLYFIVLWLLFSVLFQELSEDLIV